MTPKEKAKELVDKFDKAVNTHTNTPLKKCALIAVEEVLFILPYTCNCEDIESSTWFYESVKQEIEKL
jgi:hypothetical protein